LESDKEKFNSYIEHVQSKLKKLEDNLISLQEEYQTSGPLLLIVEQTVKSLTAERANLTAQVEAQEISASDVDRMNAERDQLAKSVTIVCDQLDQVNKAVWNKEISIQKRMDTLERLVENFNTLLYQLDLLGNDIARYSCMSEELELYIQESQPEKMVSINLRRESKVICFLWSLQ
jgi:kinetochore protein NDC80